MSHVVTLGDKDILWLRSIIMDGDQKQALQFLKERVLKQIDDSSRKGMDTSKGHL